MAGSFGPIFSRNVTYLGPAPPFRSQELSELHRHVLVQPCFARCIGRDFLVCPPSILRADLGFEIAAGARSVAACNDIVPHGHAISVAHSTAAIIFPGGGRPS